MAARTTWDPRSELAERAVEAMEAPQDEPRQVMILACGHWEWWNLSETSETNGQEMAWCARDSHPSRLLKVVDL